MSDGLDLVVRDAAALRRAIRESQPDADLRPIVLDIERAGRALTLEVTPVRKDVQGQMLPRIEAAIGSAPAMVTVRYGAWEGLTRALDRTWEVSVLSLQMLGKMLIGEASLKNLSGPLTIADYAGRTAELGWVYYIGFLALVIGVEITGLNEYAMLPFETRMRQRGLNFRLMPLHARGGVGETGKIARARALIPFYRRHEVFHRKGMCERLEQHLMSYPQPKFWDMIDALAYVVEVLAEGDQFWMPALHESSDWEACQRELREIEERDNRDYQEIQWGCV